MNPVPRAVILDLDDTLCDYSAARELRLRVAFSRAIESLDSPAAIDLDRLILESIHVQPHGTDHFADLLAPFGVTKNAVTEAVEWFRQNRFYGLKLFPESISVLRSLRRNVSQDGTFDLRRVGIVTNGPSDVQRAKLNYLDLSPLADFIVVSEEFGLAKPHPEIFQEALRLANVEAGDAVVVGDSPEFDIAGARRAGIRSIWLNRRGQTWQGLDEKPTAEIRSLTDLSLLIGDDALRTADR